MRGAQRLMIAWICLAWCATLPVPAARAQEEYFELRGAVHVHTNFSTGKESIEQIARLAIEHGVEVLVITDDDILKVRYGLPLLRDLLRYTRTEPAPFTEGTLGEYFDEIKRVGEKYPQLVLIGGLESNPFYYWDVDLAERTWTMHTFDKHIIALDLTEGAYANLPVMHGPGNERWDWTSLLLLWPLIGVAYGLVLGRAHPPGLRLGVLVISALCLINNFPFKVAYMDAYNGNPGPGPYQRYIDYVNSHGGLVLWPHPEAKSGIPPMEILGGVARVVSATPPHPEDLVDTYDYTGFAALYADNITATEPGRQWDAVLGQYLAGQRAKPIWGEGEIDYHWDQKGNQIHDILTVFLVKERTSQAVLEALRQGRMYAVRGGDEQLVLDTFEVESEIRRGIAGEEIPSQGLARISMRIDKLNGKQEEVKLRLIRSGQVIAQFSGLTPLEFQQVDTGIRPGEKIYYRLMAQSRSSRLTSNPIFVTGAGGAP
jgi:hypothetical protein